MSDRYSLHNLRWDSRFVYPEASWRKMYITQPPYELTVAGMGDLDGDGVIYLGQLEPSIPHSSCNMITGIWIIHNRDGVRMNDIASTIWTQPSETDRRTPLTTTWRLLKQDATRMID